METLLALGNAATSTSTSSASWLIGTPQCRAVEPTSSTSSGCSTSLNRDTGSTSAQRSGPCGRSWASICERASTAPMVNKATGEAASASKPTVLATGEASCRPCQENTPPSKMAQGMGLRTTPARALRAATAIPCSSAASNWDSATHSDVVITMSTTMLTMAGPAAVGPSKATSRGTPMKPVFGNAATRAPSEASFQRMRRLRLTATVKPTISRAHTR